MWDMADLSKPKADPERGQDSGLPPTKAVKRAVHPEYSPTASLDLPVGRQDRPVRHRGRMTTQR